MNIQSLKAEANEDVEALCAWLEKGAFEALALERVRSPASSFGVGVGARVSNNRSWPPWCFKSSSKASMASRTS